MIAPTDHLEELLTSLDVLAQELADCEPDEVEDDETGEYVAALWSVVTLTMALLAEHKDALTELSRAQDVLAQVAEELASPTRLAVPGRDF